MLRRKNAELISIFAFNNTQKGAIVFINFDYCSTPN